MCIISIVTISFTNAKYYTANVATSSGRTSIFRSKKGGANSGSPIYYDLTTKTDINYIQQSGNTYVNMTSPYTTVYFKDDKPK